MGPSASIESSFAREPRAPHWHLTTTELVYVLSGAVDLLAGDEVLHAIEGDPVVVPPGVDHAFGATPGADAELLVVITPGIERFNFFRAVHEVLTGEADQSMLAGSDEGYDNHAASALATERWRVSRPSKPYSTRGEPVLDGSPAGRPGSVSRPRCRWWALALRPARYAVRSQVAILRRTALVLGPVRWAASGCRTLTSLRWGAIRGRAGGCELFDVDVVPRCRQRRGVSGENSAVS
ncbi:cupin domain-containing protein [Leekyejoonella antrihumi]|uniref:cupin domain-containing protein n=1 Tax=Leekyejoonella antrihumi TaxID=1660198 RepID=UPI001645DDE3